MATTLPDVMHDHVGYLLVRLGKRAQRHFEEALVPLSLRPPLFDVLAVLAAEGALSQKSVADILQIDSARVVGLADELSELGALDRIPDPNDRRRNLLTLTAAGVEMAAQASSVALDVERDLTAALGAGDLRTVRTLLQRLL